MRRYLWLGIPLLIWAWVCLRLPYTAGALDLWMLDVGEGESVLLHDPSGRLLLYDGGPDDTVLSQLGHILPARQKKIDLVILSHPHSDHLSGLIGVLKRYQVGELWSSGTVDSSAEFKRFQELIKQEKLPTRFLFFDPATCAISNCPSTLPWGESRLQVYHPVTSQAGEKPQNAHAGTLVVKISFKQQSILLTGDLETEQENDILKSCPPPHCSLQATVLQIPHHGSSTGLLPAFLKEIAPQAALIPVGIDNPFHHPAGGILELLKQSRVPVCRTDQVGRIHVVLFADHFSRPC